MHYYQLTEEDKRAHDVLLKDTLETMLQVFRDYTGVDHSTLTEYTVEELVCGLAAELEESCGPFDGTELNALHQKLMQHLGRYKQALYEDSLPENFPTFLELVDQCIELLRVGEAGIPENELKTLLYGMLFKLGEARAWVASITDNDRALRMCAMLDSRLRAMYGEELLDGYLVDKLVKGIMESNRTLMVYAQMETLIRWLTPLQRKGEVKITVSVV